MSWTDDLTNEKLTTPESKGILSKFETAEDAHIGYVELQKSAGKPFKLPKSMDGLPDDAVRDDFKSQVGKLFGAVEKEDDLKDVNFAEGLADAREVSQELIAAFKKLAVEKKYPKSMVKELVLFNNQMSTKFKSTIESAINAADKQHIERSKETLKVLFGGDAGLNTAMENTRRMFQNNCGLTAGEYEDSIESFIENVLMRDVVMTKALMNLAKSFPEGKTEITGAPGSKTTESSKLVEQMPGTAQTLGWKK